MVFLMVKMHEGKNTGTYVELRKSKSWRIAKR